MIWSGERTLNLATRRTDSGSVGLPGPNADFRHIAANLFRRRDDVFSVRAKDPDLRLSEVHRAVPQSDSGEREKAAEAGLEIEFIRKRSVRKEDRVKELLEKRGEHAGLVCIFPAMEPCSTYKPWHSKQTGKTYLVPDDGKCLHYYFCFVDEEPGLCHVRVPTWLPCRLQICRSARMAIYWLAGQLRKLGIDYQMADNAFTHVRGSGKRRSPSPTPGKRNESMNG